MPEKKNMFVVHWDKHKLFLIPTIRINTDRFSVSKFSMSFYFLGLELYFSRYKSYTVDEFKNIIKNKRTEE
jgi:hypothetical protein